MHNGQAAALDEFIGNFEGFLHERFGTKEAERERLIAELFKNQKNPSANLTQTQLLQLETLKKDTYMHKIAHEATDLDALASYAADVLARVDKVDLKGFNFERDPDYRASFA